MKLIPNPAILQNQRIIICDDSIVRGTQLRDNILALYKYGAREIHARISCPPILYPCPFISFTTSSSTLELITRQVIEEMNEGTEVRDARCEGARNLKAFTDHRSAEYQEMVRRMAKQLQLTSLKFNTIQNLVDAIGLPKEQICTHCFDHSSCFFQMKEEKD